jgi:hypothetical protein
MKMAEQTEKTDKTVALNMNLTPIDHSDQPISANYTTVGIAQGIAYLDFGFIEPSTLRLIARTAQNGQPIPKSLEAKLGVRVAMGLDVVQRVHQQLQQILVGLNGAKGTKQ